MRSDRLLLCVGVSCVLGWAAGARGDDWPQWGGSDERNMVSRARGLSDRFDPGAKKPDGSGVDPATTKNVKWTARLGSHTYGNPTVLGGKVFLGTNDASLNDPRGLKSQGGVVLCLEEATGKPLWQLVVPKMKPPQPSFNFDHLNLGVCSSPTLEGDRVYLVTNRCEVLCLDVNGMANGNDGPFKDEGQYMAGPGKPPVTVAQTDGDIVWRYDMIAELKVWPQDASNCSVLIHGDLVYVCTSNGVDSSHRKVPSPLAPSLIALDKKTGRLVARDQEKIGTRLFHGMWSSPSLGVVNGKAQIFFGGGDGVCYAFEPAAPGDAGGVLKKVWSYDCNPPGYKIKDGKPVEYINGDIRERRKKGKVEDDGSCVGPSEIIATPVFHGNRVYVATGQDPLHGKGKGMLSCIDAAKTGDVTATGKVWSYDQIGRSLSTVSISDGLVYVADLAGLLYCLDADTGKCCWIHDLKSPAWGSTLVADGKVYIGTEKGDLWVLSAGKEKNVINKIHLGAQVYTTPIVANGVLYVASQRFLYAVRG